MTADLLRDPLQAIGDTSLLALRRIGADLGARILLKAESENPTGSMKDRMALAMIEAAESDGRLRPDGSVVEYTGGSTGVSLSLVCAVKGYPLRIVTSDAFAREKLDHMELLGARLEVIRSDAGCMTERLTRDMIDAAALLARKPGAFWTDQLNNEDQLAAYHRMGEEIWEQNRRSRRRVRPVRGHRGVGARRRRDAPPPRPRRPDRRGGARGVAGTFGRTHRRAQDRWRGGGVRRAALARRRRRPDRDGVDRSGGGHGDPARARGGLFAGTSTGANVAAALRLAEELGPDATIVTVMCDTGMKYLSTAAYRSHTSGRA